MIGVEKNHSISTFARMSRMSRKCTVSAASGNAIPTVDDLAPAGVAARGAAVKVEHLLLKRDIYYIAKNATGEHQISDYEFPGTSSWRADRLAEFFSDPNRWTADSLFSWRRSVEFPLEAAYARIDIAHMGFALARTQGMNVGQFVLAGGNHSGTASRRAVLPGRNGSPSRI